MTLRVITITQSSVCSHRSKAAWSQQKRLLIKSVPEMVPGLGEIPLSHVSPKEVNNHPTYRPSPWQYFFFHLIGLKLTWPILALQPQTLWKWRYCLLHIAVDQAQRCDRELHVLENFSKDGSSRRAQQPQRYVHTTICALSAAVFRAGLMTAFTGWHKYPKEHKEQKGNGDFQPFIPYPNWNGISWRSQKQ